MMQWVSFLIPSEIFVTLKGMSEESVLVGRGSVATAERLGAIARGR